MNSLASDEKSIDDSQHPSTYTEFGSAHMNIRLALISIGYDVIKLKLHLQELTSINNNLKVECANYQQQISDLSRLTSRAQSQSQSLPPLHDKQQLETDLTHEQMKQHLTSFLDGVIDDAAAERDKEKRKTITAMDVVNALRKNKHLFNFN